MEMQNIGESVDRRWQLLETVRLCSGASLLQFSLSFAPLVIRHEDMKPSRHQDTKTSRHQDIKTSDQSAVILIGHDSDQISKVYMILHGRLSILNTRLSILDSRFSILMALAQS